MFIYFQVEVHGNAEHWVIYSTSSVWKTVSTGITRRFIFHRFSLPRRWANVHTYQKSDWLEWVLINVFWSCIYVSGQTGLIVPYRFRRPTWVDRFYPIFSHLALSHWCAVIGLSEKTDYLWSSFSLHSALMRDSDFVVHVCLHFFIGQEECIFQLVSLHSRFPDFRLRLMFGNSIWFPSTCIFVLELFRFHNLYNAFITSGRGFEFSPSYRPKRPYQLSA